MSSQHKFWWNVISLFAKIFFDNVKRDSHSIVIRNSWLDKFAVKTSKLPYLREKWAENRFKYVLSFNRWKWLNERLIIDKSADDHCLNSDGDWAMSIASLAQIVQSIPLIVLEFRNIKLRKPTTNDINCIQCLSCWIMRNFSENFFHLTSLWK